MIIFDRVFAYCRALAHLAHGEQNFMARRYMRDQPRQYDRFPIIGYRGEPVDPVRTIGEPDK